MFSSTPFFPSTVLEWKKRNRRIRQSTAMLSFRNPILKIDRPTPQPVYNIHDPNGLKLLTRLRLGLSHLNEHKFNYNFKQCINPICSGSLEVEAVSHFFLHCDYLYYLYFSALSLLTLQILEKLFLMNSNHCVNSVQIRSFVWSVFSCILTEYGDLLCKSSYSVQIKKNTEQQKLRILTLFKQ